MKRFLCFALLFLASMGGLLLAQDTIDLQQVDIKASRIEQKRIIEPIQARKIDTLSLQSSSTANMSHLLIRHSPVFIKTYGPGGLATASFRGTTASHTLVTWNGLQLNAPSLGQVDFSTIPVFLADDVSLKWGSGTSANSGGLGGSVNIDNKMNYGKGLILDFKQLIGSFNTLGTYLTAGYSGKRAVFRLKAYRNSADNDFEYENLATIPHQRMYQRNADFTDYGLMPELSVMFKRGVLTVSSWNQWNHRNLPPIMPNVFNLNSEEWSSDWFSRNYVAYKIFWSSGSIQLKSAAFVESQNYFLETRNPQTQDVVTSINSANKALILHQIADLDQTLWKSWKLNFKLQWDREQVQSNNYDDLKRRNTVSAYLAVNGEPFKNAGVRVTARTDVVNKKFMGIFPTATFTYKMPFYEPLGISLGYSHNYRSPSLNDLYWYPGGNPDLLPEKGHTGDVALTLNIKKDNMTLDVRGGGYVSKVKNWIQWVPTSYRFWVPRNIANVFARGFEQHIEFNYAVGNWQMSLSGNYVLTFTTNETKGALDEGKQLIYIPRHHANLFATASYKKWTLSYTMEVTGSRNTSYADEGFYAFDLPAYTLHHASLSKDFGLVKIDLRCNNIFNKSYQNVIWRAMPGRSWEVVLNFKV